MASKVTIEPYMGRIDFYFIDFVFEESIELLGATFIGRRQAKSRKPDTGFKG